MTRNLKKKEEKQKETHKMKTSKGAFQLKARINY